MVQRFHKNKAGFEKLTTVVQGEMICFGIKRWGWAEDD
ncbi:hypothetical protein Vspart_00593 [Vibrio spartinae]|uniref:Uncharacterized protein n=1 Tax=Vibrio spartinae TaxID=1918945 RepID=A0ABX6QVW6_9VIBR|nr:hypothetical protein Vspart_00593 [Vibrio spartinae]